VFGGLSQYVVRGRVNAAREAVLEAADDPQLLLKSIPPGYIEAKDEANAKVVVRVGRSIFSRVKLTFTASSSRKGDKVELALISDSANIEFTLRAEESQGQTLITVEPRLLGITTNAMWKFAVETAQNLVKLVAEKALEMAATTPSRREEEAEVKATAQPFVKTAKLEDSLFEAEVALRGKALYGDITGYTSLADILEQFLDESMEKTIYIKVSFSDGYVLKILMEKGRIEGVLGEAGPKKLRGYEAVKEAERRAPTGAFVLAYAL
jgi:hypothetical protein